jgi:hypothetical protein
MYNPVATISQTLLITTIALLVIWLPLSNGTVLINSRYLAKVFGDFNINLHYNGVKVHSTVIEEFRAEMQQIIETDKERETTMNNISLSIKHQFW